MREHAARMRAAERQAELDAWQLREDEREALLDACDAAHSHYKHAWAQTAVDMLVEHVHERRAKFGEEHRARIVDMYEAVRNKRNARKAAAAGRGVDLVRAKPGEVHQRGHFDKRGSGRRGDQGRARRVRNRGVLMRKRVAVGMLVRAGEVLRIKRGATPTIFSINFDVMAEGSTTERLRA